MHSYSDTAPQGGFRNTLRRGEAWLDAKGKWAWIAFMVLGFLVNPFIGLAILAYLIWGKQMFARSCGQRRHHDQSWGRHGQRVSQPTGNSAFDDYKAQALRRLEEEQEAFEDFLQRLRSSKDKTEFDSFMEDRARATAAQDATEAATKPETGVRPGEY
ncbi:DUF2852 domain-containing protein [Rhodobacter sp. M37P]|uniref:DUF2852 domain-containing protein n=2 Tax=Rhodobacter calidifons TaxID=2715277 RepID=A0ABX0G8V5_9RHOB|nr:DUF2852 domain-containing protein [Rhodobacter calidifons]